ncbi:hypothetical protein M427DRAFT_272722 [Gonapodya prolifera JEL478]|uniref:Uncharacterized protein n=1 Tax=Gonapodya prolifera (strain JEL478) TaxID=1344416 RepID=A0A139AY83_GONPJ|nr:hypothetical protein M427DRAFT_272722 [Gonapodya prolifera JEL478]|eukprot:KXS21533.1 hypothetical protein M427DRAFT_272722 [Gonapodya prolifera JEL478]
MAYRDRGAMLEGGAVVLITRLAMLYKKKYNINWKSGFHEGFPDWLERHFMITGVVKSTKRGTGGGGTQCPRGSVEISGEQSSMFQAPAHTASFMYTTTFPKVTLTYRNRAGQEWVLWATARVQLIISDEFTLEKMGSRIGLLALAESALSRISKDFVYNGTSSVFPIGECLQCEQDTPEITCSSRP